MLGFYDDYDGRVGGNQPILTSTNIGINIRIKAFSVVPGGSRKRMSVGKIGIIDELVSTQ
jgi:hypothetical protein